MRAWLVGLFLVVPSWVLASQVEVRWTEVASVAGYHLYVQVPPADWGPPGGLPLSASPDPAPGVLVAVSTVDVAPGTSANFAVTDFDATGRESARSNVLSAVMLGDTPTVVATSTATSTGAPLATTTPAASATRTQAPLSTPTRTATRTAATATASATASVTATLGAVVSLWPTGVPAVAADSDPNAVELGVKFTSEVSGRLLGVRFYKGSPNIGTHTGSLWSLTGTRLATATFSGETATGWQQVLFASPVAITAGTVYVASYHTNVGRYAYTLSYFAETAFNAPPLHALRDGTSGGNGVYHYGSTSGFPTDTWFATNYWVDVLFAPGPAPTTVPTTTGTPLPATPTRTGTSTATRTPASTATSTAVPSASASATVSSTATATASATRTATRTATITATETATETVTLFPTQTPTVSPTRTPTLLACAALDLNGDGAVTAADVLVLQAVVDGTLTCTP